MSFFIKEQIARGIITKKNNNILMIKPSENTCNTGHKQHCDSGCSACSSVNNADNLTIYTPEASRYETGNEITFKYYVINDIIITLFAFGLPIGFALLAIGIWFLKAPEKVESPLALLSAGLGFTIGLLIIWLIDSLLRKKLPANIMTPPPSKH